VSRTGGARPLALGLLSAGVVGLGYPVVRELTSGTTRWTRSNFRGRDVSLALGPAVGAGVVGALAAAPRSVRRGAIGAVATAAVVGAYDDLYGDTHAKGLRGHARALREGRLTTGMIKAISLGGAAALGSARRSRNPVDIALGTILVAGGANLINLFDLRPGRAAKVTLACGTLLRAGPDPAAAAIATGAALAALAPDLGESAMLGDTGAGTLGAALGWAAATNGPRRRRALLAMAVVGLTLASERVSFGTVIDAHPVLRRIDRLGRRPG